MKGNNFVDYLFRRKYRQIEAVKGLTFDISAGETVGLVGPNGAGKSTTIKMLTGVLTPSSGNVQVFGRDPFEDRKENARQIGVLFGQRSQLWWDLPPEDTFQVLKRVYKIPDSIYRQNMDKYSKILGAEEFLKQPERQHKLGQRMRAEILAILLHNPKVLFLDEPTIGLDVAVKKQIRNLLRMINQETGATILLTSHDMKDIDSVCERMIVIDKGKLAVDDSVENVKKRYGTKETIEIEVEGEGAEEKKLLFPPQIKLVVEGNFIKCSYDLRDINAATVIQEVVGKYRIVDVKVKEADIDDVVEEIYGENE